MDKPLLFLKLGGSLITEKGRARTARRDVLRRLAGEIARARNASPGLQIVLGHGSGSFGHTAAEQFGTAGGVRSAEEWRGFAAVWAAADLLNRMVMDSLGSVDVPAVRIAPSSSAILEDGELKTFSAEPVAAALAAGLVPVVYGDAVFDRTRGGGIASTEAVFACLARTLHPQKILLAGIERGVYADFPARTSLLHRIRVGEAESIRGSLAGSADTDVTGGMLTKIREMLELVRTEENLEVLVFSGRPKENVRRALLGETVEGTLLEK